VNKIKIYKPSNHQSILIDWYVRSGAIVEWSKMAIWRTKPLVETMLQWKILTLVPKVPDQYAKSTNTQQFNCCHLYNQNCIINESNYTGLPKTDPYNLA